MNNRLCSGKVIVAFRRPKPQTVATLLHAALLWHGVKRMLAQGIYPGENRAS